MAAYLGHGVVGEVHVAPAQLVPDRLQLLLRAGQVRRVVGVGWVSEGERGVKERITTKGGGCSCAAWKVVRTCRCPTPPFIAMITLLSRSYFMRERSRRPALLASCSSWSSTNLRRCPPPTPEYFTSSTLVLICRRRSLSASIFAWNDKDVA